MFALHNVTVLFCFSSDPRFRNEIEIVLGAKRVEILANRLYYLVADSLTDRCIRVSYLRIYCKQRSCWKFIHARLIKLNCCDQVWGHVENIRALLCMPGHTHRHLLSSYICNDLARKTYQNCWLTYQALKPLPVVALHMWQYSDPINGHTNKQRGTHL